MLSCELQAGSEESPFLRLLAVIVKVELHVALHDILAPASADEPLPPTANPNYGEHLLASWSTEVFRACQHHWKCIAAAWLASIGSRVCLICISASVLAACAHCRLSAADASAAIER